MRVPWRDASPTATAARTSPSDAAGHGAEPFADLPSTTATHFRLWFYAAVLHLLNRVCPAFGSPEESSCFPQPAHAVAEVTEDDRFSEWSLVHTSSRQLAALVAEYGMLLP